MQFFFFFFFLFFFLLNLGRLRCLSPSLYYFSPLHSSLGTKYFEGGYKSDVNMIVFENFMDYLNIGLLRRRIFVPLTNILGTCASSESVTNLGAVMIVMRKGLDLSLIVHLIIP